jgi:beta-glucosidase/6-phospho-beta-glucosidase/beta-galactosidase
LELQLPLIRFAVKLSLSQKIFKFLLQIEGGWREDGKGPSIWDTLTHEHPDLIADHSTADVGADSYHFYGKDIEALKFVGVKFASTVQEFLSQFYYQFQHYRFSVAWSRSQSQGVQLLQSINRRAYRQQY